MPAHRDGATPFTLRLNFDRQLPVAAAAPMDYGCHSKSELAPMSSVSEFQRERQLKSSCL